MASAFSSTLDSGSKKRALLIGNNSYNQGHTLRYCINNARDLHDKLHTIHFQVILGLDLICEQMDTMIEDFVNNICPGDLVIFFFSGYGTHWNNQNFLLPIDDDQITNCQLFKDRTLNVQTTLEMIMARRPSATVFLLDCCHSYLIPTGDASRDLIDCGGLCSMQPLTDSLIVFACDAEKTALEKSTNGWNSIFTTHLREHIAQPNLSIDDMMDLICDIVTTQTNDDQCPFRASSLRKNVYFNYQIQPEGTQRRNSRFNQLIVQSQNRSLVDLRHQQLIDRDIKIVAQQIIINKQCTRLWLGGNRITSVGASILASALHNNTTLERLYLHGNHISDMGVKFISKTLSTNNNTLKILGLQDNRITDLGAEHLAQMLKTNETLTGIWLEKNDISDRGVQLIANVLERHNSTIEYLDFSKNKLISDLSVDSLEQMIKHTRSLNELSLYDCNLSRAGKERLRKAAKSKKNFTVYVNSWNE